MPLKYWLATVLGVLLNSLAFGQYFAPVSTVLDAQTWTGFNQSTYASSPVQGPDDYEDFGSQIGTDQASSQLSYLGTTTTAEVAVSIDPKAGVISVTLNATSNSGDPYPTQGLGRATIVFDVPSGSGIHLGLNMYGQSYDNSGSELTGPDGLSWDDVSSEDIASVPAGQYTLGCFAETQVITGDESPFPGQNLTTITILPEPTGLILVAGFLCLIPIRQRKI